MSLPEEPPPFKEPSFLIGRMQSGLAASFATTSPKITIKTATDLLMMKLSLMRGSHQARWLQKVISTMVNAQYSYWPKLTLTLCCQTEMWWPNLDWKKNVARDNHPTIDLNLMWNHLTCNEKVKTKKQRQNKTAWNNILIQKIKFPNSKFKPHSLPSSPLPLFIFATTILDIKNGNNE